MIVSYINRHVLYHFHWGLKKEDGRAPEIFDRLIKESRESKILDLKAIYGYYPCQSDNESLLVYKDDSCEEVLHQFDFPRLHGKCIADYFQSRSRARASGNVDTVAFSLVTIGEIASKFEQQLYQSDQYQEYLFWHGFHAAMTEALAEFIHARVFSELGFSHERSRRLRFSFGYPSCPNLQDQSKILSLLNAEKIGVRLSESFQLWPEHSTSALIVLNSESFATINLSP